MKVLKGLFITILFAAVDLAPTQAAIAVDGSSSATVSAATLTWSHTVGSGADRFLVVGVSIRGGKTVLGVTYDGQSLTPIGAQNNHDSAVRAEMWYLTSPPIGESDVIVTLTGSAKMVGGAVSFFGVDLAAPLGTLNSNFSTDTGILDPSVTLMSAADEIVVDVVAMEGSAGALSTAAGQTERWKRFYGTSGGDVAGGGSTKPGAASVTMTWNKGSKAKWAILAIALKPIAQPPNIGLTKTCTVPANCTSVSQQPNTELTFKVDFINDGGSSAANLIIVDAVPANTDFKLGTVTINAGTTGLTFVVEYSADYDPGNPPAATWGYAPVSGGGGAGAGFDRNVKAIRWRVTAGNLSQTAPNNAGSVTFISRIR